MADTTMADPAASASSSTITSLSATLQQISAELEAESALKEVRLAVPGGARGFAHERTKQAIKESLQPLETLSRSVGALLNRVHSTPGDQRECASAGSVRGEV